MNDPNQGKPGTAPGTSAVPAMKQATGERAGDFPPAGTPPSLTASPQTATSAADAVRNNEDAGSRLGQHTEPNPLLRADPSQHVAQMESKVSALRADLVKHWRELEAETGVIAAEVKGEVLKFEAWLANMLHVRFGHPAPPPPPAVPRDPNSAVR